MQDRIRVAANALIVNEGHALLVEFSGGTEVEHYNLPGGGVELGESLEEAVRREVMEETCLEIAVERLLLVVESVGSRNTNLVNGERVPWNEVRFFFLCRPVHGSEPRMPDVPDNEFQTAVRWVRLESLPSMDLLPRVAGQLLAALDDVPSSPRALIVANPG